MWNTYHASLILEAQIPFFLALPLHLPPFGTPSDPLAAFTQQFLTPVVAWSKNKKPEAFSQRLFLSPSPNRYFTFVSPVNSEGSYIFYLQIWGLCKRSTRK